jgi:D-alanine-D-alanine ligase
MFTYYPTQRNGKPHRSTTRKPPWQVAVIANLKDEFEADLDDPPDAGAEFDRLDTIEAIASALKSDGHWVHFLRGDHTLPEALMNIRPQICFNFAEGLNGNGREAQVPALCELMGIPYTASRVVANAIGLDKTQTKHIWRDHGLPTAPFQEFSSLEGIENIKLGFPMFVKPAREGTGMGIDEKAVVTNQAELRERVEWVLRAYKQPALVEEFLPGREFTVGFIGNPGSPANRRHPELYDQDGYHWFPILEIDSRSSVSPTVYGHDAKTFDIGEAGAPGYLCPADIPNSLRKQLIAITKRAAEALEVCDLSRIDYRMGADGKPYLLEINTLPGLNPSISDICIMAAAEGMTYQMLITEVLYLAAERYNMPLESESPSWLETTLTKIPQAMLTKNKRSLLPEKVMVVANRKGEK